MRKLLSVVIAAAFAAVSAGAMAQTKDVKTKDGVVKSPDKKAVTTRAVKETPKMAAPAAAKPAMQPKAKAKVGTVKTKDGPVKSPDKKDVTTKTK